MTALQVVRIQKRRKQIVIGIVAILFLVVLGIFSMSYYVATQLVDPARNTTYVHPSTVGLETKDISFISKDGTTKLVGWHMPANSNKWIIVAHGYGKKENRSLKFKDESVYLFKYFHDKGFNVVTFDFRNAGKSEGDMTTVGYKEQLDLLGAISYVKQQQPNAKIGLIGFSMGAATSLVTAPQSKDLSFVIADSSFSNLKTYLEDGLPTWSHLPAVPFTPTIMLLLPIVSGIKLDTVSPINAVEKINVPILLFHSKEDQTIPYTESEKIYNQYKNEKDITFHTFDNSEHILAFKDQPKLYESYVDEFLKAHGF